MSTKLQTVLAREALGGRVLAACELTGREWDVVLLAAGVSHNGTLYTPATVRAAVDAGVFTDAACCAYREAPAESNSALNHTDLETLETAGGPPLGNQVGHYTDIRYGEFVDAAGVAREGALARLVLHELSDTEWVRERLLAAVQHGREAILELSIDGQAASTSIVSLADAREAGHYIAANAQHLDRVLRIDELRSVHSVDLVSEASAGGNLLRCVASANPANAMKTKPDDDASAETRTAEHFIATIREHRPDMLAGIVADHTPEGQQQSLALRVIEAERERAFVRLAEGDADAGELVNKLTRILSALIANDFFDATNALLNLLVSSASAMSAQEARATPTEQPPVVDPSAAPQPAETMKNKLAETVAATTPTTETPTREATATPVDAAVPQLTDAELVAWRADAHHTALRESFATETAEATLPKPVATMIEAQIASGALATPDAVREAVTTAREMVVALNPPSVTDAGTTREALGGGGTQVIVTEDQRDKYQKRMDAMMLGKTVDGVKGFAGLHESFRIITGQNLSREQTGRHLLANMQFATPGRALNDEEFAVYHTELRESLAGASRPVREALSTGDWAQVFGDSIRRQLVQRFEHGDFQTWRKLVSSVVPLQDFRTNRRINVGGFGDLETVAELGTYPLIVDPTDAEETYAPEKRGGLYEISMETVINDDLGQIRQIPDMLGKAAGRTLEKFVSQTNLFANPNTADAVALIAAGHANNQSGALTDTLLKAALLQIRRQTEQDSAERLGIRGKILAVPSDLVPLAVKLLNSTPEVGATERETVFNYVGSLGIELVELAFVTSQVRWVVIGDPALNPTIEVGFLGGREEPELFVADQPALGSMLTADKIVYKIRHVYGGAPLNHRAFAGDLTT